MKPLTRRFATTRNGKSVLATTTAAAFLGATLFLGSAHAATQFWDVNGAAAGSGGSGNWDLVTNNWANTGTGLAVTVPWVNGNDAVFQGVAGAVVNNVAVTVKNMTINTTGYSFDGNFSVLTFAPGAVITVTNAGDSATMTTVTGGTSGLTIAGPGTLNFAGIGQNGYTGTTTVNGGTVNLNKGLSNSTIPGDLTVSGGIVNVVTGEQIANTSNVTVNGTGAFNLVNVNETIGTLAGAGTSTVNLGTGTLTIASTTATTTTYGGVISGAGGVNKTGNSTEIFSGANTYAGVTNITGAGSFLQINNATGLGSTAGGTVVGAGATLGLSGGITVGAEALTINGYGGNTQFGSPLNGALYSFGGTNTYGGAITLGSNAAISVEGIGSTTLNLNGGINKTGFDLTLTSRNPGSGTATINIGTIGGGQPGISGNSGLFNSDLIVDSVVANLNVGNSYVGNTFIRSSAGVGTLNANVADALPNSSNPNRNLRTVVVMGDASSTSGTVLNINSNGNAVQALISLNTAVGKLAVVNIANFTQLNIGNDVAGSTLVGTGTTTGLTESYYGTIAGGPSTFLVKDGISTQILVGNNTITGQIRVQNGTLQIGDGVTAGASIGAAVLTVVDAGGTLGVNLTNGSTFTNNVTDNGIVSGLIAAGTQTLSGVIGGSGIVAQNGAGTTVLTGFNTYTGATNVNTGTLQIGNGSAGSINPVSLVNVGATGTLAVNLANNGVLSNTIALTGGGKVNTIEAGNNTLSGVISGGAAGTPAFLQSGTGTTTLSALNTYLGITTVNSGVLVAAQGTVPPGAFVGNSALGFGDRTVAQGTVVNGPGILRLAPGVSITNEFLTLNNGGTLQGTGSFTGPILITGTSGTVDASGGTMTVGTINKTDSNLIFTDSLNSAPGVAVINANGAITTTNPDAAFNDDMFVTGVTANFNAANNYFGPTIITSTNVLGGNGILNANVANALPTANGRTAIFLDESKTLVATGTGGSTLNLGVSQAIGSLAGLASSKITLGANTLTIGFGTLPDIGGTANADFAGVISGTGGITKDETSRQILSGANTYGGATLISGGILVAGNNTALGAADNTAATGTTVNTGGTLELKNVTVGTERLVLNGYGSTGTNGALTNTLGQVSSWAGNIVVATNSLINANGGTLTLSGSINKTDVNLEFGDSNNSAAGVAVINVNGSIITTNAAGFNDDLIINGVTTNLNAANTYAGPTTIRSSATSGGVGGGNGILNANVANALPTANGRTTIAMDALGVGGSVLNINTSQAIASLASPNANSRVTIAGSQILTIGFGSGLNTNGTANANFAGVISGAGGLTKDGTSRQILSGANTYSGATLVSAGVLVASNNTALGAANNTAATGTTVVSGATLELNNASVGNERLVLNGFGTTGSNGALTNTLGQISSWAGNIVIATNSLINANGGIMTLSGSIDKTDVDLTFGDSNNSAAGVAIVNINGSIFTTNPAGFDDDLIVNGATVNLNTANTYAGPTTIDSTVSFGNLGDGNGILNANAVNALPTANGRTTIAMDMNGSGFGGSVLNINTSQAIASLENGDDDSNVNIAAGQTLTIGFGSGLNTNGTNNADFSAVISGAGGLTKDDTSTVIFSGTNTYTGTTSVDNGKLYVNGSIASVNTFVTRDVPLGAVGYLGGIGTINGNLTNSGVVNPGDLNLLNPTPTIGTLTVNGGNYTQTSTGVLAIDITPPGTAGLFDVLQVNGNGSLAGTVELGPTSLDSPLLDGGHVVVDTNGTLTGLFNTIKVTLAGTDTSPFFANLGNNPADSDPSNDNLPIIRGFITQVNNGQDLSLNIVHAYQNFGTTPNQVAAGLMLNVLANIHPSSLNYDSDVADFLAALDYSDASPIEAALAALDPSQYFATAAALANNNYRLHRAVETHNAAVRAASGSTMSSTTGSYSGKGGVVMSQPSTGCGTSNVWGSASYDWQDFNAENGDFDSDGETGSFTAGIDFTIANNFRLGLVAEGSRSSWDGNGSDNGTDIDSYRFGLYANYGEATGWFVDALVGYNSHSIDQDRYIGLGGIGGPDSYNNNYDADGWQGFVNAGYAFDTSAGLFSPFIGLEWQQLSVDGISDDSFIGLDGYDVNSLRGLAGVKWEMAIGGSSALYATAAYAHEFEDSADDVTVHFGSGSYDAEGLDQGDSVLLSAGLRWSVTECTTVDIGYRGELSLDDNGLDSHGANAGVNFAF